MRLGSACLAEPVSDAHHDIEFDETAMPWPVKTGVKLETLLTGLAQYDIGADQFREMVQLNQLLKQYQAYAREFGLLPRDRKRWAMA